MKPRVIAFLILSFAAWSTVAPASDFEKTAREVSQDLAQANQESQLTKADFSARLAALKQQATATEAELKRENRLLTAGRDWLALLSREHTELEQQLEGSQTQMEEMAGLVRGAARDLLALAERSPATAENPARLELLRSYMNKSRFPGLDDIQQLVEQYFQEIAASGDVVHRKGKLVDRAGVERQAELIRLGAFSTLYRLGEESGYARLGPATGRLLAAGGELPWRVESSLDDYFSGQSPSVYLDISGGAALSLLSRQASWLEHILAGGPLIWPILLVGLAALFLVTERLIFLGRVHANTDTLMDAVNRQVAEGDIKAAWAAVESQPGRPTSNVIKAGLGLEGCQPEAIKCGLAEAMLKEMPRLERFISTLKMLAAVAPLLGLLGTVSGMINTFHVITTHGTGDPRLMAGGISEALVTTELGLTVAIPILVLSSLLGRRAQHVVSDMEEKAVALTAALIRAEGPA